MDRARADRLRLDLADLCQARLDWRTLSQGAGRLLTRSFDADGWCVATSDPKSLLMTGVVADHGGADPRFFEIEYGEPGFLSQRALARGPRHVGALGIATDGDLPRSALWREMIQPFGFGDQLRAALVSKRGCWGYLALVRAAKALPFTRIDESYLSRVAGTLSEGLRRAHLSEDAAVATRDARSGVMLIDKSLRILDATTIASEHLGDLVIGQHPPAAILAVSARARATRSNETSHLRAHGAWLTAHATPMAAGDDVIAVIIEPARPETQLDLFLATVGTTARESAITREVLAGHSTDEIARRLLISPLTVQQHLKAIFDKVGVRSRRELVGLVFERHYRPLVEGAGT